MNKDNLRAAEYEVYYFLCQLLSQTIIQKIVYRTVDIYAYTRDDKPAINNSLTAKLITNENPVNSEQETFQFADQILKSVPLKCTTTLTTLTTIT